MYLRKNMFDSLAQFRGPKILTLKKSKNQNEEYFYNINSVKILKM